MFTLTQVINNKYSLSELDELMPFELEIYTSMLQDHMEKRLKEVT